MTNLKLKMKWKQENTLCLENSAIIYLENLITWLLFHIICIYRLTIVNISALRLKLAASFPYLLLSNYFLLNFRWTCSSSSTSTPINSTGAPTNNSILRPTNGTSARSSPAIPPSILPAYAYPWVHALSVRKLCTPRGSRWGSWRLSRIRTSLASWLLLWWIWHATASRVPPTGAAAPSRVTVPEAIT